MTSVQFCSRVKQGRSRLTLWALVMSVYFLVGGRGFALSPAWSILQYNCQTWGRQTGLPANGISSIAQSEDGYLWLGTAIGLVRFDGTEFKVVDLGQLPEAWSSGIVESLSRRRGGGLWVGLESSSYGFCDGKTFTIRTRDAWQGVDPAIQYVRSVLESKDGTLWLGSDNGVLRLMPSGAYEEVLGTSSHAFNKVPIINFLDCTEDHEGRIWLGTAQHGVFIWQAGKVTQFPDPSLNEWVVLAVAEDTKGRIWMGTTGGLRCYETNFAQRNIPPFYGEVRTVLADRNGSVWIGTTGQGLALYRDGACSFLRKTNGLADDYIRCLAEDKEGSLWVGTREGLSQLTDVKFITEPASENPDMKDAVAVGASRKGGIWVGNGAGLTYFDGKPKTYGLDAGLKNLYTKRVFEAADGDVYLVSGIQNLVIFAGGKVVTNYEAPGLVVGLAEDAHGVVVSVGGSFIARAEIISGRTFLPMATPDWTGCSTSPRGGRVRFGSPATPESFASRMAAIANGERRTALLILGPNGSVSNVTVWFGGPP